MQKIWPHTRRKKKKQQSMGSALSILRNLKFGSKGLLRSIKSSRHLVSLNPSPIKKRRKNAAKDQGSFPIVDPTRNMYLTGFSSGFAYLIPIRIQGFTTRI